MGPSVWKQIGWSLVVFGFFGMAYLFLKPEDGDNEDDASGFEELMPCAFLTSFDSTKSLYLSSDHVARVSGKDGQGTTWATGSWDLVDDDQHLYKLTFGGRDETFTLVSAPEGEGCMLAAGSVDSADLKKSWFSALTSPK